MFVACMRESVSSTPHWFLLCLNCFNKIINSQYIIITKLYACYFVSQDSVWLYSTPPTPHPAALLIDHKLFPLRTCLHKKVHINILPTINRPGGEEVRANYMQSRWQTRQINVLYIFREMHKIILLLFCFLLCFIFSSFHNEVCTADENVFIYIQS